MRVAMRTETSFLIGIHHETSLIVAIPAVAFATLPQVGAQDRNPKESRLVWAAKPITPTPFEPPNRLIWRLSEVLAAHKGQASWRQPVLKTRNFEADWISMAPGEKTKTVFYADGRVFWVAESGQMRVNIEGQQSFVARKGFLEPTRQPACWDFWVMLAFREIKIRRAI